MKTIMRALLIMLGMAGLRTGAVAAQDATSLEVGSTVRLIAPALGLRPVVGTVEHVGTDSLGVAFRDAQGVTTIARSEILEMDVSIGRRRRGGRGFLIGLGLGAGAGAIVGMASGDSPPGILSFSGGQKAAMGAAGLGLLGGLVGLVIGGSEREVWAPVLPVASSVSVQPRFGGRATGLQLTLSVP